MPAPQSRQTNAFPLFLTPDAQEGSKLPSYLLNNQIRILLDAGVSWDRLNPDLRAAFLLGYYLGNVRNGGHSQFLGNARNFYDGDPARFLDWAMEAAERYGMPETSTVMRDVQAWVADNPKEAATQTGFTPHRSPALKPYDTALFTADTVDEETWLARVKTLPEPHAHTFLRECGYNEGYMHFPAIISEIEELRHLAAFTPVMIVADDTFEAEVKAAAAADPVAKAVRMGALLTDLAQTLPKPATCAALSLFAKGAHLPPAECLRAGAAKLRRPKRTGVLTTTGGDQTFIAELRKDSISIFEATGDPDGLLEHGINLPSAPRGLITGLLYFVVPKYRHERAIKGAIHKRAVRKTRKLGEVSKSAGEAIAALNRRFHLPEALALWLEQRQESAAPANWRLDLVEADRIYWRFKVRDTHLRVVASAKEIQISTGGNTIVYPHEDLHAVRQSSGGMT